MSKVDSKLPRAQYDQMMAAVRYYLPVYLSGAARFRRGPIEDVKALLQLHDADVARLIGVHASLSPETEAFVRAAPVGLRHPVLSATRRRAVTQSVRGAVDWNATIRNRAQAGNDQTRFAVRIPQKDLDAPENTVALWLYQQLRVKVRSAGGSAAPSAPRHDTTKWPHRLNEMAATLQQLAADHPWLVQPEVPRATPREIARLRTSRHVFHRQYVHPAAVALFHADEPGPDAITNLLCKAYFEPDTSWRLFELYVALELVRGFDARLSHGERRLIVGAPGVAAFATYQHPNGDTTSLSYQGWPSGIGASQRAIVAAQHSLTINKSIPDIVIVRRDKANQIADVVILELKASHRRGYLASGLSELLAYLGEQPQLFSTRPSAWLVAPDSAAFADAPIIDGPLWMVSAEQVASAAVARFASAR